ncbi:hypothetical protein C8F01DRAFT_1238602 [Mycena amicta]|nr:hypothetical protein C8F01DRAFT_1238602 [Mycena amicta]
MFEHALRNGRENSANSEYCGPVFEHKQLKFPLPLGSGSRYEAQNSIGEKLDHAEAVREPVLDQPFLFFGVVRDAATGRLHHSGSPRSVRKRRSPCFHATYTAHSPCSRIARSALSRLDCFRPDLPRLASMQLECLVDGSPFTCTLDLQVSEGLPADIILGADWHVLLVAERSQSDPDTPRVQSSAFPRVAKPQASPVAVAEGQRDGPRLPTHTHSVDPPDLSPEPEGNPSGSILECRRILLSHLLTGACVEFGNHGRNGAHTACRRVSEGVAHANDLTISLLAKLGSVVSDVLATDRLEFIASCLGIHATANDTRRRSTLQRKLRAKVTILEAAALTATDVAETFNKLGDQSRPSLIALCSLHGRFMSENLF